MKIRAGAFLSITWRAWCVCYWDIKRKKIINMAIKTNDWNYYFYPSELIEMESTFARLLERMFNAITGDDILEVIEAHDPGFMYPIEPENYNPAGYPIGTVKVMLR